MVMVVLPVFPPASGHSRPASLRGWISSSALESKDWNTRSLNKQRKALESKDWETQQKLQVIMVVEQFHNCHFTGLQISGSCFQERLMSLTFSKDMFRVAAANLVHSTSFYHWGCPRPHAANGPIHFCKASQNKKELIDWHYGMGPGGHPQPNTISKLKNLYVYTWNQEAFVLYHFEGDSSSENRCDLDSTKICVSQNFGPGPGINFI